MADENVKKAQAYLNAMYGHRSEWIPLEENGYTGTVTVSGVIRAFQLENGLDPVGSVGPATLKKFKTLPVIEKMNPDDSSIPNVCLLQCALFLRVCCRRNNWYLLYIWGKRRNTTSKRC